MKGVLARGFAAALASSLLLGTAAAREDVSFDSAVASYRARRYSEAYGKLLALAHDGDADSARIVLFMHQYGPTLFGAYWDLNPDEIRVFRELALRADGRKRPDFLPPWTTAAPGRSASRRDSVQGVTAPSMSAK